ncbi:MAG TPA: hypothetical protein VFQ63_04145 [Patescibacteria group bacterium]|nr:hypothetical protein [Patescibacteria group bacterium]
MGREQSQPIISTLPQRAQGVYARLIGVPMANNMYRPLDAMGFREAALLDVQATLKVQLPGVLNLPVDARAKGLPYEKQRELESVDSAMDAIAAVLVTQEDSLTIEAARLRLSSTKSELVKMLDPIFGTDGSSTASQRLKTAMRYPATLNVYNRYTQQYYARPGQEFPQAPQRDLAFRALPLLLPDDVSSAAVKTREKVAKWTVVLSSERVDDEQMQPYKDEFVVSTQARIEAMGTRRLPSLDVQNGPKDLTENFFREDQEQLFRYLGKILKRGFTSTQLPAVMAMYPHLIKAYVSYADSHAA